MWQIPNIIIYALTIKKHTLKIINLPKNDIHNKLITHQLIKIFFSNSKLTKYLIIILKHKLFRYH